MVRLQTISTTAAATAAHMAAAAPPPGAGAREPSASSHSPIAVTATSGAPAARSLTVTGVLLDHGTRGPRTSGAQATGRRGHGRSRRVRKPDPHDSAASGRRFEHRLAPVRPRDRLHDRKPETG